MTAFFVQTVDGLPHMVEDTSPAVDQFPVLIYHRMSCTDAVLASHGHVGTYAHMVEVFGHAPISKRFDSVEPH